MKKKISLLVSFLLFTLTSFACEKHNPYLDNIWARSCDPHKTTAVYFDITNKLDKDEELLDAHTNIANMTEVHKTVTENGISQMVHIDRLVIPANKSVTFKPKGLHIMLMGVKQKLSPGDKFDLELTFKNAGKRTYEVTVK